jgi:hypothetical protein
MPKTILGWIILIVVVYVIFRTIGAANAGAANAGAATGHGVHNGATFISSFLNSL